MSLRAYLWGLKLSTFLALIGWGLIVFYVDPERSGLAGQALFYASLFLVLTGIFATFLVLIRKQKVEGEEQLFHIGMSLRQGLFLALLAIILLLMQHFRVLIWWDGLLVVAGVLLLELYFLSR